MILLDYLNYCSQDITEKMLTWPAMIVYIGLGGMTSNILIDDVSIKLADENTYSILDCN